VSLGEERLLGGVFLLFFAVLGLLGGGPEVEVGQEVVLVGEVRRLEQEEMVGLGWVW
jgi:hypothetical protein